MSRLLVVCGVVALGGAAAAQGPRYSRTQPSPVPPVISERVRLLVAVPAAPPSIGIDLDTVLGTQLGQVRPEQEQILVGLIGATPDSEVEEKSDYYFRLAQLYSMQSRTWRQTSATVKDPKEVTSAALKSKDYLLKAVKIYKALTDNDAFRNYPMLDRALFDYGYTLQTGKYLKEARAVYDKLLKNFPNSAFVPQAHLAFGDYYFEQGQLADAEARYKVILKFPGSSAYGYARYKLGWVDYQLAKYQEALEAFFQVAQATANDRKQEQLHRAATDAFVDAYVQIGKPDKARAAFARVDEKRAVEMVQRMADRALEGGKFDVSIALYRDMIKEAPARPEACHWQYNVAHAMLSMPAATNADKVTEIEKLLALAPATGLPAEEAAECKANAAALGRELARAWHLESVKAFNDDALGYAERLYKAYLAQFPADDQAASAYAEVLWTRASNERLVRLQPERWGAAAEAFMSAAAITQDPRLRDEAAAAGVLAYRNGADPAGVNEVVDLEAAARAKPAEKPMPDRESKVLAALESYADKATEDTLVQLRLVTAGMRRSYGQYDRAIAPLVDVVTNHRDHASAELAANLLLDSLVRAQQYDLVLQWVDKLAADAGWLSTKPALQQNIKFLRSRSLRRR